MNTNKEKILFICTGNICRSPIAEGIFVNLLKHEGMENNFIVDSAGTVAWCAGNPPDRYAQAALNKNGIDISQLKARRITREDLEYFDLVLVADEENFQDVYELSSSKNKNKIKYLMEFAGSEYGQIIPDPYGEGLQGFIDVVVMIEKACAGLLIELKKQSSVPDR